MHNRRAKKKLTLAFDESGATAIFIALIFSVICGFVALVVDIGHIVKVKAEVQRTADAGALAGVTGLVPYTHTGTYETPNWSQGQTKAHTIIATEANKVDNPKVTPEGTVDYGYWLLAPPTGYVQTLPKARPTTAAYLPVPAIIVTLSRNVTLYFAPLVGFTSPMTVSATAIAILPEGYNIATGAFAMAVEKSIVYTNPNNTIILTPQDFGWKDQGQWFTTPASAHSNDVPTIRKFDPVQAGDIIWIAPGSMNTLYPTIIPNQTVMVPVVESTDPKHEQVIIGFAAFYITGVQQNSVAGHFVDNYMSPDANPGTGAGTYLGVSGTPKLVSP
jgi:Flp pilus assembly protein TadG